LTSVESLEKFFVGRKNFRSASEKFSESRKIFRQRPGGRAPEIFGTPTPKSSKIGENPDFREFRRNWRFSWGPPQGNGGSKSPKFGVGPRKQGGVSPLGAVFRSFSRISENPEFGSGWSVRNFGIFENRRKKLAKKSILKNDGSKKKDVLKRPSV